MSNKRVMAQANVVTNEMRVHPDYYKLQPHVRYLVYLHEKGHLATGSTDEKTAWKWALPLYLKKYSSEQLQDALHKMELWHGGKEWANFVFQLAGLILSGGSFAASQYAKNKMEEKQRQYTREAEADYFNQYDMQTRAAYQNMIQQKKLMTSISYITGSITVLALIYLLYTEFKKS